MGGAKGPYLLGHRIFAKKRGFKNKTLKSSKKEGGSFQRTKHGSLTFRKAPRRINPIRGLPEQRTKVPPGKAKSAKSTKIKDGRKRRISGRRRELA